MFLAVAALPRWELSMEVVQLLGFRGPWWPQVCRDMDCLSHRTYGPIRVFSWASCSWWSAGLFDQSFSVAPPGQALRGLPCLESSDVWSIRHIKGAPLAGVLLCRLAHQTLKGVPWVGPYSVFWSINHLKEHRGWGEVLLCSSMHQAFDRPASLLFSCRCWRVGRGRLWWWLHPLCMTQQYRLVSMAAQLSSTGISHHNILPHIPSICLSAVNNSLHPGVVL